MRSNYLIFQLTGRLFGARLRGAIEILAWRRSRPVPLAYGHVDGLLDYRGTIYPVFRLARRLGLSQPGPIGFNAEKKKPAETGQSIILLEENNRPFGILVDAVAKMAFLEETTADPEKAYGVDPRYVRGVAYEEEQEIVILDFERLFHAG
jgi:chemotaxis signal transduction protein